MKKANNNPNEKGNNKSTFDNMVEKGINTEGKFNPFRISIRIAGIYFVLGCLWILLSDKITSFLISDKELITLISMIKGWLYVLVSASLIFILIFSYLKRIIKTEQKLLESYRELSSAHEELETVYEEVTASEEELRQQYDQLIENQRLLMESEERYRLISEASNDGIWDEKNGERFFSDRWFEIMGYTRDELQEIGNWKELIHPDDKEYAIGTMEEHKRLKTPFYCCDYRIRRKDGEYIWIQARGKAMFDDAGRVCRVAGSHTDITALKSSQEKLRYLAYHDFLTGLPNKLSLQKEAKKDIFASVNKKAALLFIDMDNFKYINDTIGHASGDELIVKASERLTSLLKDNCTLYRLGGDEFVIIVRDIGSKEDAEVFASHILTGFKDRFEVSDNILNVSLSIGIVIYPGHGKNINDLLKCADIAMYKAKEKGKKRYVVYSQPLEEAFFERMNIEKHLHSALERHEFEIYYQPQLDIKSNKVTGFEALLRWKSPELGFISPLKFIKIAEDTHLIIPLGSWVLRSACAFLKRLQQSGFTDLTMSVNISVLQLLQSDFVGTIKDTLEFHEVEPEYLELEITESILVESFEVIGLKLKKLRDMGVRIALDDFGKGYSSLSYLKQLPITTLKIDKSFIDGVHTDNGNKTLTGHIITIGNDMGMCVIAEGVEKQEQLEYLIRQECHKIQGYLFSKPVPEGEVERLLKPDLIWDIN